MKNLLNPRWLILINILPVLLLFVLFYGNYNVIESLLAIKIKSLWFKFGLTLFGLTCLLSAYLIFCIIQKKQLSVYYALISLLSYSLLIYCYSEYSNMLIPGSIPNWMISSEVILYPGTFLMPTLAHALFILVVMTSSKPSTTNAGLNFLYSLSIPLAAYIFAQIVLPLWQNQDRFFGYHALIILCITASILFLFFLCRAVYILTTLQSDTLLKYSIYWKITIALVLPLLGLGFNNGLFTGKYKFAEFMFGNFSQIWFYIIAIVNGLLICLPTPENFNLRITRISGLLICFPYTIYFLIVFLPYLPFAIIATFLIGIGFLMLAPLFLFILQTNELYKEFKFLNHHYSSLKATFLSIIALSTIPIIITGFNLHDRKVLNNALTYVYSPDYSKTYYVDKNTLQGTLSTIKTNKDRNNLFANSNTPYISTYYNWLVLDNMILSDLKINTLEQIFFGKKKKSLTIVEDKTVNSVKLSKIKNTSRFDKKQQSWISTLDLELTNSGDMNLAIYETEFSLPDGCWISNYYLNVGTRRENGILAEKKSTLWVFSNIRNENRDPGILYYLTGNKIAFKVFPFSAKEARKTGIEFIHKEPFTLNFDRVMVPFGKADSSFRPKVESINQTTYIPANEKAKLKLINRKPIYHFIVDVSKGKEKNIRSYLTRIKKLTTTHQLKKEDIRLNLTNSFANEIQMDKDWKTKLNKHRYDGGFYLDAAIKKILINNYKNREKSFPIMIVLTESLSDAVIQNDFLDFKMTYPESSFFYELDADHKLWTHSFNSNSKSRLTTTTKLIDSVPVYAWPNVTSPTAYLPKDDRPSIVTDNQSESNIIQADKKSWLSGLNLHGMQIRAITNNNSSNEEHIHLIKQSMISEILSPLTSFIVVENEAQKKALLEKQKQIISGNKNLDPDEDTQSMSEPNIYLLIGLLLTLFMIYRFKERKKQKALLKAINFRLKS